MRRDNAALQAAVRNAELRVAAWRAGCAQARKAAMTPPDQSDAQQRVTQARGSRGALDITLAWNGKEDLDLHVYCAGGHLYHATAEACGGRLQVDQNRTVGDAVAKPIEHATWASRPTGSGPYRVVVVLHARHNEPQRPVPFTVVVRQNDKDRMYNGVVQELRVESEVTRLEP